MQALTLYTGSKGALGSLQHGGGPGIFGYKGIEVLGVKVPGSEFRVQGWRLCGEMLRSEYHHGHS